MPLPADSRSELPAHLLTAHVGRSLTAFAADWLLIVACFAAAVYFTNPLVDVAAALLIGRTQLALAVLMHDGAHGSLAKSRVVNDVLGQTLAAGPLLLSMFAYRGGHLQHHRAPMAADDPVAVVFGIGDFPISRRRLAWRLLKDFTSLGYWQSVRDFASGKFRHVLVRDRTARPMRTVLVLGSIAMTNGILLGSLAAAGHAGLYLGLWILPALTVLQVCARVRAIFEHAGYGPADDQTLNSRSIGRPTWQTFWFGPHGAHFHIEHHRHVRVPFHRLRAVHEWMNLRGELPATNLYRGYGAVLKSVTH